MAKKIIILPLYGLEGLLKQFIIVHTMQQIRYEFFQDFKSNVNLA